MLGAASTQFRLKLHFEKNNRISLLDKVYNFYTMTDIYKFGPCMHGPLIITLIALARHYTSHFTKLKKFCETPLSKEDTEKVRTPTVQAPLLVRISSETIWHSR